MFGFPKVRRAALRVGVAVAACASAMASATAAAGEGIDFAAMPIGCRWHTALSDRPTEVSTYVGERSGFHVIEVTTGRGRPVATVFNTPDGHYAQRVFPDGRWERFTPHTCFAVEGRCESTYERGDGLRVRQWSEGRRSGDGFVVRSGEVGGAAYAAEAYRLGPFNVIAESRNETYAARVTKFERCDAPAG